jgi:phospholipase C
MAQNIQHLVVLMLENRAFDHMLGFLKNSNPNIDGLTGTEWNPSNPLNPTDHITVSPTAEFVLDPDPGHSLPDTNTQLFSSLSGPPPVGASNAGFIWDYSQQHPAPVDPTIIMKCFDPAKLPVLTTLAQEFAVCDAWFSSVPGPTWPNRFFAHAATSKGFITNSQFNNYDMPTIFESLAAQGLTWRDYYHDFSQTWSLQRLQTPANRINFKSFGRFKSDAQNGTLPNYAFIEPKYFSFFGQANDQHPPHDMRAGEKLIARVYEALRHSPQWPNTMLVVTYDEHGGTYDHVLPPAATPPDANTSQFAFDRYGVRVPAVIVSPFVPAGTVLHDLFDHTSIPATLAGLFTLPAFLTARDAAANTFAGVASLTAARTSLPDLSQAASGALMPASRAVEPPEDDDTVDGEATELSDFQEELLELARSLERQHAPLSARSRAAARRPRTEQEAAVYVRSVAARMSATVPAVRPSRRGAATRDRAATREGSATTYRAVVPPRSSVRLPFAHSGTGDPAEVRFTVYSAQNQIESTARYLATVDAPYGSGNLEDPAQGDLPPVVFNDDDAEMYVDVSVSVGEPSFSVKLEYDVEETSHGTAVAQFTLDGEPLVTTLVRR